MLMTWPSLGERFHEFDDCVAVIERARDLIGVTNVDCTFTFGSIDLETARRSMRLFASDVIPRLREQGRLPLYCRSYKDPLAALTEECARQARLRPREDEPPLEYLRRVATAARLTRARRLIREFSPSIYPPPL